MTQTQAVLSEAGEAAVEAGLKAYHDLRDYADGLEAENRDHIVTIEAQRSEISLLEARVAWLEPELKRLSAKCDHYIRVNAGIAAKVDDGAKTILSVVQWVRDAAFAKAPEIASPAQDTQLSAADEAKLADLTQRLAPRGNGNGTMTKGDSD